MKEQITFRFDDANFNTKKVRLKLPPKQEEVL